MLALNTDVLLPFFSLSVLLALTPGPDNLFVLIQSAQHGWRAGMLVVLGLGLGLVGHTCAVALGLAAVLMASPAAFTLMKTVGAFYLLWLAWGAWNAPATARPAIAAQAAPTPLPKRPWRWVGRGIVMNLSNPKVLMFFLAFLPQFVDASRGQVSQQIALLGAIFALAAFWVFGAIAVFSGFFGQWLQGSAHAQRWLNRTASVVFVALAARLLLAERI
ncbi:LysE family translocator [Allofranklinella schreckenbergeri]|uniref:LysE family translocator n=1 Tax=Allofranklinella schreckenbergeri TaxID=1076744 RepID=A0A3M6R1H5_9BURK|nr:LysE family translocator [Allofranklinella schreckenbergeri]RMX09107.1 LysE family translocator [Allofranklinella schreckenbergeri]